MYMRRLCFGLILSLLIATIATGSVAASATPTVAASGTPVDDFVVPSVTPTPIPDRLDVSSCSGETCDGTDPQKTGCAAPENGSYTQTQLEVHDEHGIVLGNLLLRANDRGCDSTQWAQFRDLTHPLTFELRVVQNHTGIATQTVRMEEWREDTWTMQLHSPDERVRAEIVIYGKDGSVITRAVTASY